MIEVDLLLSDTPAVVAQEITAVALFLNDDRFPDLRCSSDIEEEYPRSFQNCIPGAIFLTQVLMECDSQGAWRAVFGKATHEWHAFVLGRDDVVADVTGDQFGFAAALVKPLALATDYNNVSGLLEEAGCVDAGDRRTVRRWSAEWRLYRDRYRAEAVALFGTPVRSPGREASCLAPGSVKLGPWGMRKPSCRMRTP